MEFKAFTADDLVPAARLLAQRHALERRAFPTLRAAFEDGERTERILSEMLEDASSVGLCAYENGEMKGYLLSDVRADAVLGRRAFIPYEGMAVAQDESPELYRQMYARIAEMWLDQGALAHYAVVPAGDPRAADAWLRLSFAYQQVYGITELKASEARVPQGLSVRLAEAGDREALRAVSNLIYAYQAAAPTYAAALPERIAEIREGYGDMAADDDTITLLAYAGNELIGFQCADTQDDGDCMMLPERCVEISVCGTIKEKRGTGVGSLLTARMMNRALDAGYQNAIVDWRMANLSSSRFWPKMGFRPVAYRMFRQIDERVYWAKGQTGVSCAE